MKKLIATEFDYVANFPGHLNNPVTSPGSYLGRKPANERTIRKFLRDNARKYSCGMKLLSVTVKHSWESPWIHKF